ncbi:hypothetical protein pdam_00021493 [Pocillopora damicornis]|uniref:MalT-like TPR region domain-containing protein n=1 Tax=Pocillopora damicornis TaxID=46731 RepID=A0A3M6TCP7_POCDA|nr:hypothetical protein pdam_00021493 [Pocillopora damicornis]
MTESNLPRTGEELEVKNEFPATATEESQVTSSDAELDAYNDPLRGIAKACLEEGNKEYRQGEANNAINSYTEGLQVNCKDKRLNAKLYSNRATAHFRLGNYVECLDDATVAVQLEPTLNKAIKKGEFFRRKSSTFYSRQKRIVWFVAEIVKVCLEKGNKEYRQGEANNAINSYTEGLQVNCKDKWLNAKLYSNRATAHFRLGNDFISNYVECLDDATVAVELEPSLIKAIKKATEESQVTSSDAELDVDDDLLREIAKVSLEKGNREYRQEEANNAINFYTEGLRVNCKDKRMNAKLYSNRATAHFRLANYVECLDDATVAVQLEPTLIKAIKKGARACVELCLYKEGRSWLQMGLAIENDNKRLLQLLRTTNAELILIANSSSYLGNAYQELGKFKTTIKYHQRQLEIAKLVGDKTEEGRNYCNLGNTYQNLGQFKTAIQYHQRHLEVAKEVGDKAGEGISYGSLGNAYQGLGQFKTAIQYHQRHQEIAKEVGDKAGEGISYGNLSNAYNSLGQFKTAIQYHQRHLEIAKEVGDKAEEGISYGSLGNAYQGLGQFETAIQYHQRHQDIAKEVGDKAGEGIRAEACVELCRYKEARSWLYMGLAECIVELESVLEAQESKGKSQKSPSVVQPVSPENARTSQGHMTLMVLYGCCELSLTIISVAEISITDSLSGLVSHVFSNL